MLHTHITTHTDITTWSDLSGHVRSHRCRDECPPSWTSLITSLWHDQGSFLQDLCCCYGNTNKQLWLVDDEGWGTVMVLPQLSWFTYHHHHHLTKGWDWSHAVSSGPTQRGRSNAVICESPPSVFLSDFLQMIFVCYHGNNLLELKVLPPVCCLFIILWWGWRILNLHKLWTSSI